MTEVLENIRLEQLSNYGYLNQFAYLLRRKSLSQKFSLVSYIPMFALSFSILILYMVKK